MATATPPKVQVKSQQEPEINKIFRQLIKHEGSDLHLQVGKTTVLRIKGTLRELKNDPI